MSARGVAASLGHSTVTWDRTWFTLFGVAMPSITLGDWPRRECLGVPWGVGVDEVRGAFIGMDGVWEGSADCLDRSDASDG